MADTVHTTLDPQLNRRGFLKGCTMAAAALGLSETMIPKLVEAAAAAERPRVVWLHFQECTGCTESLLRASHPDLAHLILDVISLDYHETVMAAAGHQAEEMLQKTVTELSAAKADGQCVLAFPKSGLHIELIEIDPFPVVGDCRGKFLVTGNMPPVDPGVVDTETADAKGRRPHLAIQSDLLAKVTGRKNRVSLKDIAFVVTSNPFSAIFSGGKGQRGDKSRNSC